MYHQENTDQKICDLQKVKHVFKSLKDGPESSKQIIFKLLVMIALIGFYYLKQ